MRCFIAIKIPEDVSRSIYHLQKEIEESGFIQGNFVREYHLTLKFLGEVDEKKIADISDSLSLLSKQRKKFEMSVSGIGGFPSNNFVQVLWAGFEHNKKLLELQASIDKELVKLGFKPEKDFVPHITLARVKRVLSKELLKALFEQNSEKIFGTFILDKILLMKSELTPDGPIYEALKEFPLG